MVNVINGYFLNTLVIAVLGGAIAFCSPAGANSRWYVSAGLSQFHVENTDDTSFSPSGITLRTGVRITRLVDAELSLTGNSQDNHDIIEEYSASVAGLMLKKYHLLGNRFAWYGAAGVSVSELVQTSNDTELSLGVKGASAGFGIEAVFFNDMLFFMDAVLHGLNGNDPVVSGLSIGLKWDF